MTDTVKLEEKILRSGKKKGFLAERLGLSRQGLKNCLTNKAEFKASHIQILCDELGITDLKERDAIFFARRGA